MSSALLTPQTAPRSADEITNAGVFQHRRLAESLYELGHKLWTTDKEKTAFLTASPAERASALVAKLREFDTANGGAPSPAATAARTPQASTQAADPAPAAEDTGSKRQPRTSQTQSTNGHAASAAAPGNAQELLTVVKTIGEKVSSLEAAFGRIAGSGDEGEARLKKLEQELLETKALVATLLNLSKVQIGILTLFGQQVLGAGMEEFLPAAIGDADKAIDILEESGGKG